MRCPKDVIVKKQDRSVRGWVLRFLFAGLWLVLAAGVLWFGPAIYRRLYVFPAIASELQALRKTLSPAEPPAGWREFKGIIHSHSHLSHDCEVSFEEILECLQRTGRDFICMSDHCINGLADFGAQWRGLHEGKLFIPGYEMKNGLMPFGVAPGIVLTNNTSTAELIRQIVAGHGLLFYAHPEEPRDWDQPELVGMEIYNVHADFKDERSGFLQILPDILLSFGRYPGLVYHRIFDRPVANLAKWDQLNNSRHITGIGGNDCHQNTGWRILCTVSNTIRIEDTSPKTIFELRLNFVTRLAASAIFGRLEPGRKLFSFQLDPYDLVASHVTTHVFAQSLTEEDILDSLRAGRVFVGFDLLADSTGFLWLAENNLGTALPGESLILMSGTTLRAHAPCKCRMTILRNGTPVYQATGTDVRWSPAQPGVYRVEAELDLLGNWTPWVYANPIWLIPEKSLEGSPGAEILQTPMPTTTQ